jgi:thymidylate synthase (FAD)
MDADRVNCFNGYSASSRALAVQNYDWYLENDFSREIARIDLPLSTYTQWYWKIDLHNLMHFLKLRCEPAAQWEIRQYALRMAAIMREVVPIAFDAWENFQLNSMTFSAEEMSQVKATIFETSYVGTSTELIHKITNWKPIEIPPIDSFAVADVGFLEEQWNR